MNDDDIVEINTSDRIKYYYNEDGLDMIIKIPSQLMDMINQKRFIFWLF